MNVYKNLHTCFEYHNVHLREHRLSRANMPKPYSVHLVKCVPQASTTYNDVFVPVQKFYANAELSYSQLQKTCPRYDNTSSSSSWSLLSVVVAFVLSCCAVAVAVARPKLVLVLVPIAIVVAAALQATRKFRVRRRLKWPLLSIHTAGHCRHCFQAEFQG